MLNNSLIERFKRREDMTKDNIFQSLNRVYFDEGVILRTCIENILYKQLHSLNLTKDVRVLYDMEIRYAQRQLDVFRGRN